MKVWVLYLIYCFDVSFSSSAKKPIDRHIIVIGGGLAGLSAAMEIALSNANLTLIEGEIAVGGNSARATSGINACDTPIQQKFGIRDSYDKFYADTMKAGHYENSAEKIDILVHQSTDAFEFLTKMGIDLGDVSILGGHSVPRTHWLPSRKEGTPKPVGAAIIHALWDRLEKLRENLVLLGLGDKLQTLLVTTAVDLLMDESGSRVIGVKVRNAEGEKDIYGDSVIVATGGYSNDHTNDSLLAEFSPNFQNFPTSNGPFATGSGVKMARKIGANLLEMGRVQLHATGFVDPADPTSKTKYLAADSLRANGAIMLNHYGRRFSNELDKQDSLSGEILKNCQFNSTANAYIAYLLLNKKVVDKYGWPSFTFFWKVKQFFQEVNNVQELEEVTKMPAAKVKRTFFEYDQANLGRATDPYGKKIFPVPFLANETLYFSVITPVLHYTIGGLETNVDGQVLNVNKYPIEGLYAAGEVTGGVHGDSRLSGNSLIECVVFGRIVGIHASTK